MMPTPTCPSKQTNPTSQRRKEEKFIKNHYVIGNPRARALETLDMIKKQGRGSKMFPICSILLLIG
jgi:hypothetical protein